MRFLLWVIPLGALVAGVVIAGRADPPAGLPSRLRQPVALADGGTWLFAANRRAGTVSAIDTRDLRCAAETAVGRRLSDLAALPGGDRLLATDEEAHELIVLTRRGPE